MTYIKRHIVTQETREKIRKAILGSKNPKGSLAKMGTKNPMYGKRYTEEEKKRIGEVALRRNKEGKPVNQYGAYKGLEKRKRENRRADSAYIEWRRLIFKRDSYKCRINNDDCQGRMEAHHILAWRSHPELRYEINNGITLCHYHHPRRRIDEEMLIPYFKNIVEAIEYNLSGAHRLGTGELSEEHPDSTGEEYLKQVQEELTGDHAANEGSEEDNTQTSDKL